MFTHIAETVIEFKLCNQFDYAAYQVSSHSRNIICCSLKQSCISLRIILSTTVSCWLREPEF
jgi:hypothetical protein